MKAALFIYGGWEGHQPRETAELMAQALVKHNFQIELAGNLQVLEDAAKLARMDLIVPVWTMGQISQEQVLNLLAAVRHGTGLAGWHGGMGDAFRSCPEFQFAVGGQFVCHPGGIVEYEVRIREHDDPIMIGLTNFKLTSEQYYMHVDPSNKVLASTFFSGEHEGFDWIRGVELPAVWKRRYGQGRVFYSSLGHNGADFQVPQVKEITTRGLIWAAR